jgi:CheY-like chemotaxis protein
MYRIILVEDDLESLYATQRTLERAGYTVMAYGHASQAWDVVRTVTFDLLLTDIRFPDGEPHGLALARHLRVLRSDIPIIFMTGYSDLTKEIPESLGPVLVKPVPRETLLTAVHNALGSRLRC